MLTLNLDVWLTCKKRPGFKISIKRVILPENGVPFALLYT